MLAFACSDDSDTTTTEPSTDSDSSSQAERGGSTFKVAIVGNFTTNVGTLHSASYAGLEAYAKAVNDRGGIAGSELEIVKRDGANDVARLTAAVKEMDEDPSVLAIVGLGAFAQQTSLASVVEEAEIPAIANPTSSYALFGDEIPHNWLFGLGVDVQRAMPQAIIGYVLDETPGGSVGLFGVDAPSTAAAAEAIGRSIEEAGGTVTGTELVPQDATDVRAAADNLLDAEPDWIVVAGAAPAHIQSLLNTIKVSSRPEQKVITVGGAGTAQFELADSTGYHSSSPAMQATEDIRDMVEAVGGDAALQNEDTFVTFGWILGMVLEAAFTECGEGCTRESVRDALEAIEDFDTGDLSGPVSFADDHQGFRSTGIFRWDAEDSQPVLDTGWLPAYG
jgi:ABC-type branched-subunit amino acid transport system substrate-binding protein